MSSDCVNYMSGHIDTYFAYTHVGIHECSGVTSATHVFEVLKMKIVE